MRWVVVMAVAVCLCCCTSTAPTPQLTAQHRSAIVDALNTAGLPSPQSLEINTSRYLVATFELKGRVTSESARAFAEKALLTIRNTMQSQHLVTSYRVTLNGLPPGPGLILRYGNARFIEGGTLEWEPAN